MSAVEFEIDGTRFRYNGLGVAEGFAGLDQLAAIAGPAIADFLAGKPVVMLSLLAPGFAKIPALLQLFAGACDVQWTMAGPRTAAPWLPLVQLTDDVFKGRHAAAINFCGQCAAIEYADFLSGGVASVAARFQTLFESLSAKMVTSGES